MVKKFSICRNNLWEWQFEMYFEIGNGEKVTSESYMLSINIKKWITTL